MTYFLIIIVWIQSNINFLCFFYIIKYCLFNLSLLTLNKDQHIKFLIKGLYNLPSSFEVIIFFEKKIKIAKKFEKFISV
jgi:hypothetical protein